MGVRGHLNHAPPSPPVATLALGRCPSSLLNGMLGELWIHPVYFGGEEGEEKNFCPFQELNCDSLFIHPLALPGYQQSYPDFTITASTACLAVSVEL